MMLPSKPGFDIYVCQNLSFEFNLWKWQSWVKFSTVLISLGGARRSQKAKKSPVWMGLIQASVASAHAAYRQMYWLKIVESRWIAKKDAKTPYSLFLNYLLLLQFAPSTSGSLAGGKIESHRFTLKFWVSIGFNFLQWDNSNILTKKKRK